MRVGEKWFVKRPGATALVEVEVTDITPKTVQILEVGGGVWASCYRRPERYELGRVAFVELVSAAPSEGEERER